VNEECTVTVTLPADVQQLDATGYVWAFLDTAAEPDRVRPGARIVAGDADEPFLARVVDVVDGPGGRSIVHLDVRRRAGSGHRRAPPRSSAPPVTATTSATKRGRNRLRRAPPKAASRSHARDFRGIFVRPGGGPEAPNAVT